MDRPNCRNKAAFSNFSGVLCTLRKVARTTDASRKQHMQGKHLTASDQLGGGGGGGERNGPP